MPNIPLHHRNRRTGVATLWVILLIPCVLTLICLVGEVGRLWLARVELENALEAAALAAVKEWGDAGGVGGTFAPRQVGVEYAKSNTVVGATSPLAPFNDNFNGGMTNGNNACDGNLVFGAIDAATDPNIVVFNPNLSPTGGSGDEFGVRAQATVEIPLLCGSLFGAIGPFRVSAKTDAVFSSTTSTPRLIRIHTFVPCN